MPDAINKKIMLVFNINYLIAYKQLIFKIINKF